MQFKYVKNYYKVPAEMHREVIVDGKKGVITKDMGNYIGVNFYENVTAEPLPCHPSPYIFPGLTSFRSSKSTIPYTPAFAELFPCEINLTISEVERIVCAEYRTRREKLHLKTRRREILQVRQICSYFMHKYCDISLKDIGVYYGQDHTTVINSKKTVAARFDTEKVYRNKVCRIEMEIKKLRA